MIRYVMKRRRRDDMAQLEWEQIETTTDSSEMEAKLRSGGHGPLGYDYFELIGVEVLEEST